MKERKDLRCGEHFFEVLGNSLGTRGTAPAVNSRFVTQESEEAVRLSERVLSFGRYMANVRYQNAASGTSAAYFREVASQAQQTVVDGLSMTSRMLRLVRHAKHAGIVAENLESWKAALGEVGTVRLSDAWADMLELDDVPDLFAELGVSQDTIAAITREVDQSDAELAVRDDRLAFKMLQGDRSGFIALRPAPEQATNVVDLLYGNQFDAAVEAFDQPGSFGFAFAPGFADGNDEEVFDPLEIVLGIALRLKEELIGDYRQLQHSGIALYQGGSVVALLIAAIVAVVIISTYAGFKCIEARDEGRDSDWCWVGLIGFIVVSLLGIKLDCEIDPETGVCKRVKDLARTFENPESL